MYKRVISFSRPQNDWLEAEAERLGVSVAELVRRAIDWYRGEVPTVFHDLNEDDSSVADNSSVE